MYLYFFLLLLSSCCTGKRAETIAPPEGLQRAVDQASSNPRFQVGESLEAEWWRRFDDPQLTQFIQTTFVKNPTLQAARAKILQATYAADLTRSALFPTLTLGGDISREKFSETGVIPFTTRPQPVKTPPLAGTGGQGGIPVYFTQYETENLLTFDFDLWGKNRSLWRAGIGEARARIADAAFLHLQLSTAVAATYFQLQILYQRQECAKASVENQRKIAALNQIRLEGNLDSSQVVLQAKANVASANQSLLQIQNEIAIGESQLKVYLAGNFEEQILQIEKLPLPKVPMPSDLPLHLLSHRPDIAAQLWLIWSAGHQIDAAVAGFYPDVNLAALFGYQTIHLHKLFEYPSTMYNVNPAFTLPIFDGYHLLANLRGSEVNYDLAILNYNDMLLNAAKEVLDGVAVLKNHEEQWRQYLEQLRDQKELVSLSQLRLQQNLDSDLDLLAREQNLLLSQDQELAAYGQVLQAIIQLIKALGGGYQE